MTFRDQLVKIDACPDSLKWVKNKTIEEAWKTCKNPEWMLWVLAKTGLDLIDPLCDMAERVLHLVPEESQLACIWAISAARRRANEDELDAAATAAEAIADAEGEAATEDADCAAYSASDAAAYAKYFATYATCSASDNVADYAADYAARAVAVAACYAYRTAHCANNTDSYAVAVSVSAADSAFRTAYNREQKNQCDILRKYFTIDQVKEVFKKLVS